MKSLVKAMFKNGNDFLQGKITREVFLERHVEHERLVRDGKQGQLPYVEGGIENGRGPSNRQGHDSKS